MSGISGDGGRVMDRDGTRIDPRQGYAFIKAHRGEFPLVAMCRALGLSRSGYYGWLRRPPSARSQFDDELRDRIRTIWSDSHGAYGAPRIHAALREEGVRVGQKRVARLMSGMGLRGGGPGVRVSKRMTATTLPANGMREPKRG